MKKLLPFLCLIFSCSSLIAQLPCSLDNTFDLDGRLISDANKSGERIISLQDGSALVAYNPFGNGTAIIRHVLVDGSIDNTYGTSGKTTIQVLSTWTEIHALLLLNNELYICGSSGDGSDIIAFVTKLKSDGLVDINYGNSGMVTFPSFFTFNDMVFEPNTNKIIVAGMKSTTKSTIARLDTNGFLDTSFGNNGSTEVSTGSITTYYEIRDIQIDKQNQYLLTGKYYTTSGTSIFTKLVVMRFNSNGSIDNSFDTDGIAFYNSAVNSHDEGRKIFADALNDYFVCGSSYTNSSNWDYSVLKINHDGSVQNTFGSNGWKRYDLTNQSKTEVLLNAEMMSNGNILMTGNQGGGDTVYFAMLKIKPDGSYDNTFAPNGLFMNIFGTNNNSSSAGLAITPEGKIYLSGYTRTCTGGTCGPLSLGIARYFGGDFPSEVDDFSLKNEVKIYPNPVSTNGVFYLDHVKNELLKVQAINILGEEMDIHKLASNEYQIKNATKGIYFIRIQDATGKKDIIQLSIQ